MLPSRANPSHLRLADPNENSRLKIHSNKQEISKKKTLMGHTGDATGVPRGYHWGYLQETPWVPQGYPLGCPEVAPE